MERDEGRKERWTRRRRIERKEGDWERERVGGREGAEGLLQGGGGTETVTAVAVVTSHTVWLSHAHSPGHRGRTRSTHTHMKHDSSPLILHNWHKVKNRETEREEGKKRAKVAESGESKRFKSQERSGVSVRFLIHLLNVRGLVSSGFKQRRNVFVTEIMIPPKKLSLLSVPIGRSGLMPQALHN